MGRRESSNASGKANLPSKSCVTCGLPMVWRKKWAKNWDEVRYCSERCRRTKSDSSASAKQG